MSLREEMTRYEHLTGEIAEHTPIIRIGAFLDGVDRGIEELKKIKAEIDNIIYGMEMCDEISAEAYTQIAARTERIFDNYIEELKGEEE